MKKQFYFASKDDEMCYEKSYFKSVMEYEGWSEMTLYKAISQYVSDMFWCNHFSAVLDQSENQCGFHCKGYVPKNGKSGCCKHFSKKLYEPSDETLIIKL